MGKASKPLPQGKNENRRPNPISGGYGSRRPPEWTGRPGPDGKIQDEKDDNG